MPENAPSLIGTPRRPRYASRGQALIMVVLIMLLLAGLGGMFAAMINQSLVQTARAADRQALDAITQAGFNQVKQQLLYSPDGADWRPDLGPDQANRGWVHYGDGFYKITVGYGPSHPINQTTPFLSNPLDRYLKIDIEASFGVPNQPQFADISDPAFQDYQLGYANPKRFLSRKMTAFMPIALTDYLLWITNLHGGGDPAVVGTDLTLDDNYSNSDGSNNNGSACIRTVALPMGDPTAYDDSTAVNSTSSGINYAGFASTATVNCLPLYDGPIRSEVDLQVGQGRFDLTNVNADGNADAAAYSAKYYIQRNDLVEVAGKLTDYEGCSSSCRKLMFEGHAIQMPVIPLDHDPVNALASGSTGQLIVPYLQTQQTNPQVQPLHAPRLDTPRSPLALNRYRALTRDSGEWSDASAYNTGYIGWGEGAYLNNPDQMQIDSSGLRDPIEYQRAQWMNGSGTSWTSNGCYTPEGAGDLYNAQTASALVLLLKDWSDVNGGATAVTSYTNTPYIEIHEYYNAAASNLVSHLFAQNGIALNAASSGTTSFDNCTYAYGTGTDSVGTYYFAQHPYPRNGVIFAEGNLVVKGKLPASLAFTTPGAPATDWINTQHWGGWNPTDGSTGYYVNAFNRRYDLTIVSAATIYIEGSVMTPASVNANYLTGGALTPITAGSEYDSKLALLAMDNVCLNPTRLFADIRSELLPSPNPDNTNGEASYQAGSAANIIFNFSTAGSFNPRTRLILRHAADANSVSGTAIATSMQLYVNNAAATTQYNWASALNIVNPALYTQQHLNPLVPTSLFFYNLNSLPAYSGTNCSLTAEIYGGPVYASADTTNYNASSSFNTQSWPLNNNPFSSLYTFNQLNTFIFKVFDPTSQMNNANGSCTGITFGADYLLSAGCNSANSGFNSGCLVTCVDVRVDALIYAERGSWFVIPGQFWNTNSDSSATVLWPAPKYREPYDVRILVNGAIAENRPAPPDMEKQWLRHWRGADIWYYTTGAYGAATPDLWDPAHAGWNAASWHYTNDNRRMGITYQYDATLARPVCYDVDPNNPGIRYYRPRLPRLPVGENTDIMWKMQGT